MTLKGYIDDSGSDPSSPTFVLAGYVLPAEAWASFSDKWSQALLRGKPIAHLHMMDLGKHAKNSQFQGWDIEDIEEKLMSSAEVIQAYQPFALSARAQWSEYQKFKRQKYAR